MLSLIPSRSSALTRLKGSLTNLVSGGSLSDRWKKWTTDDQYEKSIETFRMMQGELLRPSVWTFEEFRNYNLKLFNAYGGNEAKAKPTRKRTELDEDYQERVSKWESDVLKKMDPSVRALRRKIQILDFLNPVELKSNHKSIFADSAKRQIASKAGVPVAEVNALILEHDGLRADRKWYQTRIMMKLPLPGTMEQREQWAQLDRPFSRSEMEFARKEQEKRMKSAKRDQVKPKRITSYVFRTPSKGISRWNHRH
jgi:hypothetical protein